MAPFWSQQSKQSAAGAPKRGALLAGNHEPSHRQSLSVVAAESLKARAARAQAQERAAERAAGGWTLLRAAKCLLALLTLLVAGAVVAVVAGALTSYSQQQNAADNVSVATMTCYMTNRDINLCLYSYFAAAAAILVCFVLLLLSLASFAQCLAARSRRGCALATEVLLSLLLTAWLVACAVTTMVYGREADSAGVPNQGWRTAAWAMAWAAAGLSGVHSLLGLAECCCGGVRGGGGGDTLV